MNRHARRVCCLILLYLLALHITARSKPSYTHYESSSFSDQCCLQASLKIIKQTKQTVITTRCGTARSVCTDVTVVFHFQPIISSRLL